MNYPKVSIIILNWNGLDDTIECLESLKKITYPNYEVIVVDNGSEGNDVEVLRQKFGDYIHIIENDKNYGFAEGNNIAIRRLLDNSSPDYFLLLNNDTVVDAEFLTELIKAAEANAAIGMVGPKVYYYDFPNRIQSAGAKINFVTGQISLIGNKQIDSGQYDKQQEVDYVTGCCLLAKKQVIQKVRLFDESYFCYWEETDYSTRARKAGYKMGYIPQAKLWHKNPPMKVKEKIWHKSPTGGKTTASLYYYTRNNFKFMRKHATRWEYWGFLLYFFGYYLWFMIGVSLLYHRDIKRLIGFCRGVRDGLLDRAGANS